MLVFEVYFVSTVLAIMADERLRPLWNIGPEVWSPFDSAITISYLCSIHIFRLTCSIRKLNAFFSIAFAAESRFRLLKMTSPLDRVTRVFCSCSIDICRVSSTVSDLRASFTIVGCGEMSVSAARGYSRQG